MATLRVHADRLEIRLSTAEKLLALRRGNISIPRRGIRSATITEDPWIWVRGIRSPGTNLPLTLAVGTWKFHGGTDFLLIKRARLAVVIDIDDGDFERVIVTTSLAAELVHALRLGTSTGPITTEFIPEHNVGQVPVE